VNSVRNGSSLQQNRRKPPSDPGKRRGKSRSNPRLQPSSADLCVRRGTAARRTPARPQANRLHLSSEEDGQSFRIPELIDPWDNTSLIAKYTSNSQRARVVSEAWVSTNGYCLACRSDRLLATTANTRTRDFLCPQCHHGYELKSKHGVFGTRIPDGAFSAMMTTIREGRTPSFLLLEFSPDWQVRALTAVHHSLINQECIEKRKALGPAARRAGWVGCNIILPKIALDGRIPLVTGGYALPRGGPRTAFARLQFLSRMPAEKRGWAATVLNLVRQLPDDRFSLSDAYLFEARLAKLYPENKNVRPKIRQQLQVLRDAGIIQFEARGQYKFIKGERSGDFG
jgi:type II restriction enzyme